MCTKKQYRVPSAKCREDSLRYSAPGTQYSALSTEYGASLIELVMFMTIIGIALAGVVLAMNQTIAHGADVLLHKQALTVAESMLEEIEMQGISGGSCTGTLGANAPRSGVSTVCDYKGYSTTAGILDYASNAPVSGLGNYNVAPPIEVVAAALGNIPAGSAVMITVHVTDPVGKVFDATGFRTNY